MNRAKINAWVDVFALISFIIIAVTGIALLFSVNLSVPRYNIKWLHDWFGIAFVLLAIAHILLHKNWWKALPKLLR